ncbi:MAG: hypothetical protein HY864_12725 [Chloroflexi bacterium]|nr:hypothetical protein [Chloroflexota bacterium]
MDSWFDLEKRIIDWLISFSSEKIQFRNSYQAIVGFPTSGFRSDGMLTDGKILFAVEVEAGQTHPDTNVGKYWFLHDEYPKYSKIILFHIYTPAFNSYESRRKLASFYAEKMKGSFPFDYKLFDCPKESSFEEAFRNVKSEIELTLNQNFEIT